MTERTPPNTVPRGALIGAACLVAFTIVAALVGHLSGVGHVTSSPGQVAETRDLRFEDRADGAVLVTAAADGRVVDVIAPNTNHFVRSALRGLIRTRKLEHIGSAPPFRLSRLADGRVTLEDPATRRRLELNAFGRPNVGAFAAILDAAVRIE